MANEIALIERELDKDFMPSLHNILTQTPSLPSVAFRSAFLESVARNPTLLSCTRMSLFNCAVSFSFLGLLPGGATGQAFMLPFRDKKNNVVNAVPVTGYKGFNTIAARSGIAIEGMCIRKDDKYSFNPAQGKLSHEVNIEASDAQIVGCWSQLFREGHRYSQRVLGIKQLLVTKSKSMGARKDDSPWNDRVGPGFEAMCEKTGRRLQARSIPLNAFLMADAVETVHDLGRPAWIVPAERDGQPVLMTPEGQQHPPPPDKDEDQPPVLPKNFKIVAKTGPKQERACKDIAEWKRLMLTMIRQTKGISGIQNARKANAKMMMDLANAGFEIDVNDVMNAFNEMESVE